MQLRIDMIWRFSLAQIPGGANLLHWSQFEIYNYNFYFTSNFDFLFLW